MEQSNSGGNNASVSDLSVSPRQKPDISSGLLRVQESLRAWKKLLANGEVEPLVVKIDAPPGLAGAPRMLSDDELAQLRATKHQLGSYLERIFQTAPLK